MIKLNTKNPLFFLTVLNLLGVCIYLLSYFLIPIHLRVGNIIELVAWSMFSIFPFYLSVKRMEINWTEELTKDSLQNPKTNNLDLTITKVFSYCVASLVFLLLIIRILMLHYPEIEKWKL